MDKQWYRVAPGVTRVNGARVIPGQRLELDRAEAIFDLGLERIIGDDGISPQIETPMPPRRRRPRKKVNNGGV